MCDRYIPVHDHSLCGPFKTSCPCLALRFNLHAYTRCVLKQNTDATVGKKVQNDIPNTFLEEKVKVIGFYVI